MELNADKIPKTGRIGRFVKILEKKITEKHFDKNHKRFG
jgi:hypothetical protein